MRIYVDANIIVTVLNKEYPLFPYAARLLSLCTVSKTKIYTSPICLAIAFYFVKKKHGSKIAKEKIQKLAEHLRIAHCGTEEATNAVSDKKVTDLEDGFEYYSALGVKADYIITEDKNDFYYSIIPVLNTYEFLQKIV